jgi:hypothetical protein
MVSSLVCGIIGTSGYITGPVRLSVLADILAVVSNIRIRPRGKAQTFSSYSASLSAKITHLMVNLVRPRINKIINPALF